MSFSCLTIWLLIIQLNVVTGLGEECPVCTNKYDHNSCTQTVSCDADMNYCELIVKPDDFYSLEYVCKQALDCTKQTTVPCDPSANKTCIYCCDGPTICQLQREELYNNEFPASGFLVQSTTSESPVKTTSATLLVTTPTESVATTLSTAHTTTSTTTTTLPEGNVIECPVCSDAYDHATCLGVQKCPLYADAVCQLVVQTTGLLRLEYQCGRYEVCAVREATGCHPEVNDTCVYCCSDPIVCQLQRDDLVKYEFPDLGLQVSPTTTASTVRSTSTTSPTTRSTAVVPTKTPATHVTSTNSTTTLSPADSATIECPVCSDQHDHTTCSGIQKCSGDDAVCQLVIHTTGLLGLEYQCGHFEVCAVREADGCHPRVNNTCVYCCSDSIICQIQRDDLFTYELPSLGLPTNIAATSVSTTTRTTRTTTATTHTPVTTTSQTTSTVSPATETETTAASTAAQTTKASTTTTTRAQTTASTRAQTTASTRAQTTASTRAQTTASTRAQTTASTRAPPTTTTASTRAQTTASTRAPTTTTLQTTTTSPITPAVSVIECVQCGSLSGHTPCSQDNHAVNTPQLCPGYLPYCFTSYTQNGTEISAYKGCASADFCSLEYEITSTKKECDGDPDPSSPRHVSCGYCCNRDACNASPKPPASSLVTFP